jgi:hypothetical protein
MTEKELIVKVLELASVLDYQEAARMEASRAGDRVVQATADQVEADARLAEAISKVDAVRTELKGVL